MPAAAAPRLPRGVGAEVRGPRRLERRAFRKGVRAVSVQNRTGLTSQAPSPVQRRLGLALLGIANAGLMLVLDDTIVNVALPSMQRSLHLATSHLNWVISFYALAFGRLMPAGGRRGRVFVVWMVY